MKHHILRTLLLLGLSCAGTVYAVTLGQARVMSFLGQPLEAEIDLFGLEPGQHQDLNLRIANDSEFQRLNIFYTKFLDTLAFDVAQSSGRWIVRARSKQPVREPYLDFPLHVSWTGGQLTRQYTLLLNPPKRRQAALAKSDKRSASSSTSSETSRYASSYGPVRRGEILTAIAQKLKPNGITTWQMSVVLFRANPQAFIKGSINRLRVGSMLHIPQLDTIEELDNPTAIAAFAAETTREQTPLATSPRTAQASPALTSDASPKTGTSTKEPINERARGDAASGVPMIDDAQLRVVSKKVEKEVKAEERQVLENELLMAMEDAETHSITSDGLENRLARMEAQLQRMERLLELKNAQIAAIQTETRTPDPSVHPSETQRAEPPPLNAGAAGGPSEASRSTLLNVQQTAPLPTVAEAPAIADSHQEYHWLVWPALGLAAISVLLVLAYRSRTSNVETNIFELADARRTNASRTPVAAQTPPADPVAEGPVEPVVTTAHRRQSAPPATEAPPVPPLRSSTAAPANVPGRVYTPPVSRAFQSTEPPEVEASPNFGHQAIDVTIADISDDDLASWAAQLDEGIAQNPTQETSAHAAEPPNPSPVEPNPADEEPIELEFDIPELQLESEQAPTAHEHEHESIPTPIESPPGDDLDPGADAHTDGPDTGDDVEDFSLSLDLARAYIEIGDEAGAKEILEQALARKPDHAHRNQFEALLANVG